DAGTIDQVAFDLQKAEFHNCIIYGTNQVELRINKSAINPNVNWTTPVFNKVLVKFNNSNNDYTNHPDYEFLYDTSNVKKNQNPRFEDVSRNKLRIGEDSAAIGFGDPLISQQVPVDLAGQLRNTSSDLGAYQSTTFGE